MEATRLSKTITPQEWWQVSNPQAWHRKRSHSHKLEARSLDKAPLKELRGLPQFHLKAIIITASNLLVDLLAKNLRQVSHLPQEVEDNFLQDFYKGLQIATQGDSQQPSQITFIPGKCLIWDIKSEVPQEDQILAEQQV